MQTAELQRALLARGFDVGKVDGDFGKATLSALKAFQKANGLSDGIGPGPQTVAALTAVQPAEQRMSAIGLAALVAREGRKLTAYLDTAKTPVWTIGVGHTAAAGPPVPKAGMTITAAECDAIFSRDIVQYEQAVRRAVTVPLAEHQFDALVAVCFNIGTDGTATSTFVKRINSRATPAAIRTAILMWTKNKELVSRRTAEADQFATPYSVAMPKARSTDAKRVSV